MSPRRAAAHSGPGAAWRRATAHPKHAGGRPSIHPSAHEAHEARAGGRYVKAALGDGAELLCVERAAHGVEPPRGNKRTRKQTDANKQTNTNTNAHANTNTQTTA